MQRFIYTPRVEAYIRLESLGRIIDVTDDIVAGSVTRRLNGMSEAQLQLQNKHGRYTLGSKGNKISSMDRIVIRASRVGQPFNIFAGYIDESPHYQLYSGPVNVRASCVLKLLQHTYFDPGLQSVASVFNKAGFIADLSGTGALHTTQAFDSLDSTGNVRDLLINVLADIGG